MNKLKDNDFLTRLNLDHADDGQKIALLNQIIDNELEKPESETDMDLIEECMGLIRDLDGERFTKTDAELAAGLQKIRSASGQPAPDRARPGKTRPRRPFIKVAAILAAALLIVAASLAVAANIGGPPDQVSPTPDPAETAKTVTRYTTVDELFASERLNVLYPAALPKGVAIENIRVTSYDGGKVDLIYEFSSPDLEFAVYNYDLSKYSVSQEQITLEINGYPFGFSYLPDGSCKASCVINGYAYAVHCTNYQAILNVVQNLKEYDFEKATGD